AGVLPDRPGHAVLGGHLGAPQLLASVCNRGTEPVGAGVPFAFYSPGEVQRCSGVTTEPLGPGECTAVSCPSLDALGDTVLVVDDGGTVRECREDNNQAALVDRCP